jgi:hypothetical protein
VVKWPFVLYRPALVQYPPTYRANWLAGPEVAREYLEVEHLFLASYHRVSIVRFGLLLVGDPHFEIPRQDIG